MSDRVDREQPTREEDRATVGLLMEVAHRTRQNFEAVAAEFGLSPVQARTLLELRTAEPMRAIADLLRCDASNVTGIADRLEARGLITRTSRPGDRRVKLLAPTEEGVRVRAALKAAVNEASPLMSALDADERRVLRELLAKARDGGLSRR